VQEKATESVAKLAKKVVYSSAISIIMLAVSDNENKK
jgi:hypothetical protein